MLAESRPGVDGLSGEGAGARGWRRAVPDLATVPPDVWLVIAITAAAALLRFSTITSQSFWIDEATTVHEVGLSFGGMLHAVGHNESTPPLYFALAWVWTRIFGSGELGIRSLSAVVGTVTVPVVYLCGRELISRSAGVAAAALAAVSPFLIWYSQEARAYMLFGLLSGLALLFCARATRTGATRDIGWWALVSILTLLTHFFAVLAIAPMAAWLLVRLRSRVAVIGCGCVAVTQAAIVPLAIADQSHPLLSWILEFRLANRIQQIPVELGASQLYKSAAITWGLPVAAVLLALVAGLVWLGGGRRERRGAMIAGGLAAIVILVPVIAAVLGRDYVFSRNFMPAWIPLSLAVGAACAAPRARVLGGALLAVLILGFIWAGINVDGSSFYRRPNWRGVAAALGPAARPRAVIAYDGNAAEQPLAVYLPRAGFTYSGLPADPAPVTVSEVDVVGDPAQSVPRRLPAGVHRLGAAVVDQYLVERFSVDPAWRLAPAAIAARATTLLGPAPPGLPAILIQK